MFRRYEPPAEADAAAHATIGAAVEVHRHLGPGFLEAVYERALEAEFIARGIRFERQKRIALEYKGVPVGEQKLDLVVAGVLVVELKCVDSLGPIHYAQLGSYLRAGALPLGLLINFNCAALKHGIRRVIPPQHSFTE